MHPSWICIICGVRNNNPKCWQCGHVYETATAADSALDRASIPAMFNVVGDELRKSNDRLSAIEARLSDLKVMDAKIDAQNQGLCNLFDLVSTELVPVRSRLATIESQLTALRAEADKGLNDLINRERYTALLNWCEALNNGQDRIETCQEKHRLALESITRILEKVTGTGRELDADELEHLAFIKEAALGKRARKKKQERKRRGGK